MDNYNNQIHLTKDQKILKMVDKLRKFSILALLAHIPPISIIIIIFFAPPFSLFFFTGFYLAVAIYEIKEHRIRYGKAGPKRAVAYITGFTLHLICSIILLCMLLNAGPDPSGLNIVNALLIPICGALITIPYGISIIIIMIYEKIKK